MKKIEYYYDLIFFNKKNENVLKHVIILKAKRRNYYKYINFHVANCISDK